MPGVGSFRISQFTSSNSNIDLTSLLSLLPHPPRFCLPHFQGDYLHVVVPGSSRLTSTNITTPRGESLSLPKAPAKSWIGLSLSQLGSIIVDSGMVSNCQAWVNLEPGVGSALPKPNGLRTE